MPGSARSRASSCLLGARRTGSCSCSRRCSRRSLFVVAPAGIKQRVYSIFDPNDPTNRDRLRDAGRSAPAMVRDHPLFGVGPEMVEARVSGSTVRPTPCNATNPHLHNVPMQIAAERGLPALAAWLVVRRRRGRATCSASSRAARAAPSPRAGLAAIVAMLAAGLLRVQLRRLGVPDAVSRTDHAALRRGRAAALRLHAGDPARAAPASARRMSVARSPDVALTALAGRRVAVIGDVMLDHFLVGRVDRISPEAPVPVVRFDRDEYRLGGAANVAHNVAALGGARATRRPRRRRRRGGDAAARRSRRRGLGAGGSRHRRGAPDDAQDAGRDVAQPAGGAHRLRRRTREPGAGARGGARRARSPPPRAAARRDRAVRLPQGRRHAARSSRRRSAAARARGVAAARRSQGAAGRAVPRRDAHHAESSRSRADDADARSAPTTTRGARRGCCTSARARASHHVGRARHVGARRDRRRRPSRRRCRRRRARSPTSPAPATPSSRCWRSRSPPARRSRRRAARQPRRRPRRRALRPGRRHARRAHRAASADAGTDAGAGCSRRATRCVWARAFRRSSPRCSSCTGFTSDDPDSALYAGSAASPVRRARRALDRAGVVGLLAEAQLTGLFREHPAGVFCCRRRSAALGIPRRPGRVHRRRRRGPGVACC